MHNGDFSARPGPTSGKKPPSSVVGVVLGLVIGGGGFLLLWQVSPIRSQATALVFALPKPVWVLILLLAIGGGAGAVWVLLSGVARTDDEEPGATEVVQAESRAEQTGDTPLRAAVSPSQEKQKPKTTPLPFLAHHQSKRKRGGTPAEKPPSASVLHSWPVKPETILSITLLKDLTLTIHLPGGRGTRPIPVSVTTKRAQLLAYLAARRGEVVHRDKLLYHVFAWRREDGTASDETTANNFHSHTKLLRTDIRTMIMAINAEAGELLIDPNLDPFVTSKEHWGLAPCCEVVDLEEIERQYQIIAQARKDGLLTDEIPLFVKEACERLLAAYPGDFLAEIIEKNLDDFKPWDGKSSWARRFTTHYRTCFLAAQWYLGQYEEYQAQQYWDARQTLLKEGWNGDEVLAIVEHLLGKETVEASEQRANGDEEVRKNLLVAALEYEQRMAYGRAIAPYKSYATTACLTPYYVGSPFDEQVSYQASTGRFGDRVKASEQALRRCLKACAFTGNTRDAGEIYATYAAQMSSLFKGWGLEWQPSTETQRELESVKGLTDAHRFSTITTQQAG